MTTTMEDLSARRTPRISLNEAQPPEHQPSLRLLTSAEYEQMIAAGIFNEDDRVELLEGVIVEMSPKGVKHAASTDRAARYFLRLLGERVIVRNQNPIKLNDHSEPEPDLVLAAPEQYEYAFKHPRPKDIYLVLEMADTTLAYDRQSKGPSYAKAGIVQYLILNLNEMEIEDYREPSADGYRSKQTYTRGQRFDLVCFPGLTVGVNDLLPPTQKARPTTKSKGNPKAGKAHRRKAG
ncbi:MAG TPA: Uma2 family endonuclease [Pyrinomonadaceae bacterium]|nr:Uma2 family endonuclease [Pyrinomonadaceae bacterium]